MYMVDVLSSLIITSSLLTKALLFTEHDVETNYSCAVAVQPITEHIIVLSST